MDKQERDKRAEWKKEFRGYFESVSGELPSKWSVDDAMGGPYGSGESAYNAAGIELEDLGYEPAEIEMKMDAHANSLLKGSCA